MKSYCEVCKRETNHEVIKEEIEHWSDEEQGMYSETKYQIIRCNGCEKISFREEGWFSEDFDPYTGKLLMRVSRYPNVSENDIQFKRIIGVPKKINRIYKETIDSYNNENYTLCAAGLRAIIEGICAEEKIQNGPIVIKNPDGIIKTIHKDNLQGKIGGLFEKNLLTKNHADVLHQHRFLGNEAVHELDIPSTEELKLAINILEHTLENIYELKYKAEELQWKRELRKKKI